MWSIGLSNKLAAMIITNNFDSWNELRETAKTANTKIVSILKEKNHEYPVVITLYDNLQKENIPFISVFNQTIHFDMYKRISK